VRLTEGQAQAFLGDNIRPALLGYFDFSSGPVRLWAPGVGKIQWNGFDWEGCGALAQIGSLEESSEGRAITTELELSPLPVIQEVDGVDIDLLQIAHNEDWHQRPARLYIGLFEADSLRWKVEPIQFRKGFMDVMELTEAGTTARIRLTLERRDFDNERAEVQRYTPANQRDRYPGDAFCDQIPLLQDKPVRWNLA
jgi:hypothetical protein